MKYIFKKTLETKHLPNQKLPYDFCKEPVNLIYNVEYTKDEKKIQELNILFTDKLKIFRSLSELGIEGRIDWVFFFVHTVDFLLISLS